VWTYAGVIVMPPMFAALHDRMHWSYGTGFALLSIVTLLGVGCVVLARRAAAASRNS
jgi:hypothetical protein